MSADNSRLVDFGDHFYAPPTWFSGSHAINLTGWGDKFGTLANDRTFIPFTYGYTEGLLGPAVGAHPQGAKPQGYDSWAEPPQILEFSGNDFLPSHRMVGIKGGEIL
jgi:hypothetical protein